MTRSPRNPVQLWPCSPSSDTAPTSEDEGFADPESCPYKEVPLLGACWDWLRTEGQPLGLQVMPWGEKERKNKRSERGQGTGLGSLTAFSLPLRGLLSPRIEVESPVVCMAEARQERAEMVGCAPPPQRAGD